MQRMAREKATITVDRAKLAEAKAILGTPSASATIDAALSMVVERARLRADLEAYQRTPPNVDERNLAEIDRDFSDLLDDTDWEAQWPADA